MKKPAHWKPDIENLYKVFRHEKTERPVLFELFMNNPLYERVSGRKVSGVEPLEALKGIVDAFAALGYDYATVFASDLAFPSRERHGKSTVSLNDGFVITDEASFEAYVWPEPDNLDYSILDKISGYLHDGMKLMVVGPSGVLEITIQLVGYENMCYMLYEEPELLKRIVNSIGSRLLRHYEIAASYDSVGIVMSNDDWGFNTQTFLTPETMRDYIFPWHRRIVQAAQKAGKPAILHSCGYFGDIMDDVIDMGFSARHSYEDNILPIEQSYDTWGERIALLGGLDVDFIIRSSEDDIKRRSRDMLERTRQKGGYALGTGNSVPEYMPHEKYFAMLKAAYEFI